MHSSKRTADASSRRSRGSTQAPSATPKGGGEPRVLYWYRTPPGVKVGREPFDAATRRTLEAQYPGITFDWRKIAETAFPPPDAEYWRERRRAEKAARQTRRAVREEEIALDEMGVGDEEADEAARDEPTPPADEGEDAEIGEVVAAADEGTEKPELADEHSAPAMAGRGIVDSPVDSEDGGIDTDSFTPSAAGSEGAVQAEMPGSAAPRPERRGRSRRRRRGRRGGSGSGQAPAGSGSPG